MLMGIGEPWCHMRSNHNWLYSAICYWLFRSHDHCWLFITYQDLSHCGLFIVFNHLSLTIFRTWPLRTRSGDEDDASGTRSRPPSAGTRRRSALPASSLKQVSRKSIKDFGVRLRYFLIQRFKLYILLARWISNMCCRAFAIDIIQSSFAISFNNSFKSRLRQVGNISFSQNTEVYCFVPWEWGDRLQVFYGVMML